MTLSSSCWVLFELLYMAIVVCIVAFASQLCTLGDWGRPDRVDRADKVTLTSLICTIFNVSIVVFSVIGHLALLC